MTNKFLQTVLAKKASSKKQNGFTLIELMVVIAIVGVLSAVGLPELLKAQDSAKDSAALQEAVAAAKTCSIDILTEGTAYADAIAKNGAADAVWEYVSGTCNVTTGAGSIVGTGPGKTHTITVTDGVPGKPLTAAVVAGAPAPLPGDTNGDGVVDGDD